jgi:hypothetical protein
MHCEGPGRFAVGIGLGLMALSLIVHRISYIVSRTTYNDAMRRAGNAVL